MQAISVEFKRSALFCFSSNLFVINLRQIYLKPDLHLLRRIHADLLLQNCGTDFTEASTILNGWNSFQKPTEDQRTSQVLRRYSLTFLQGVGSFKIHLNSQQGGKDQGLRYQNLLTSPSPLPR